MSQCQHVTKECDAGADSKVEPHLHSSSTLSGSSSQRAFFKASISSFLFCTLSAYDMPVSTQAGLRSSNSLSVSSSIFWCFSRLDMSSVIWLSVLLSIDSAFVFWDSFEAIEVVVALLNETNSASACFSSAAVV